MKTHPGHKGEGDSRTGGGLGVIGKLVSPLPKEMPEGNQEDQESPSNLKVLTQVKIHRRLHSQEKGVAKEEDREGQRSKKVKTDGAEMRIQSPKGREKAKIPNPSQSRTNLRKAGEPEG